jgi:hypothetical protein
VGVGGGYRRFPSREIFDEHVEVYHVDEKGEPCAPTDRGAKKVVRRFSRKELKEIAARCNARTRTGALTPLSLGHTDPDQPDEAKQPRLVGYAKNFKVRKQSKRRGGKWVLCADFFVKQAHLEEARTFPRVSIELWPEDKVIDPIALLRRTPQRDLAQWVSYSKKQQQQQQQQRQQPEEKKKRSESQAASSQRGLVLRYSLEHKMGQPKKKKKKTRQPDRYANTGRVPNLNPKESHGSAPHPSRSGFAPMGTHIGPEAKRSQPPGGGYKPPTLTDRGSAFDVSRAPDAPPPPPPAPNERGGGVRAVAGTEGRGGLEDSNKDHGLPNVPGKRTKRGAGGGYEADGEGAERYSADDDDEEYEDEDYEAEDGFDDGGVDDFADEDDDAGDGFDDFGGDDGEGEDDGVGEFDEHGGGADESGHRERMEQFMAHCFSHPHARALCDHYAAMAEAEEDSDGGAGDDDIIGDEEGGEESSGGTDPTDMPDFEEEPEFASPEEEEEGDGGDGDFDDDDDDDESIDDGGGGVGLRGGDAEFDFGGRDSSGGEAEEEEEEGGEGEEEQQPVRHSGAAFASATNGGVKGTVKKIKGKGGSGGSSAYRKDAEAVRYARLQNKLLTLEREAAEAKAQQIVTQLVAEGYELDPDLEVPAFAALSDKGRAARASHLRRYYKQAPTLAVPRILPALGGGGEAENNGGGEADGGSSMPAEVGAAQHKKAMQYMREHPGTSYNEALRRYSRGGTPAAANKQKNRRK